MVTLSILILSRFLSPPPTAFICKRCNRSPEFPPWKGKGIAALYSWSSGVTKTDSYGTIWRRMITFTQHMAKSTF
ncbi:unnamed protein product [Lactuca virosa]|uniref:Secreted protein n=1 Tax=Lactuca virosa TaxID=75947 RepID=A0AAU9P645_9ASTR|nr:unnamed protein product [Lactuca virosa]